MSYKGFNCHLVFFQRCSDSLVKTYTAVARDKNQDSDADPQWNLDPNTETFFTQRRIRKAKHSEPYVYIRVPMRDTRPLAEIVEEYTAQSKEIHECIRIDPLKIGSLQDTAWYVFTKGLNAARLDLPVANAQEGRWLHFAHRGGLMWAKNGFLGETWKYDITSFYPSICKSDRLFPASKATMVYLTESPTLQELQAPAIYRVFIHGAHPLLRLKPIDKPCQEFMYVTNLDLLNARDLDVPYSLALNENKWANCMQFSKCVEGTRVYGTYVDTFFAMKKDGKQTGKYMLNVLTGLLVSKSKIHISARALDWDMNLTSALIQSHTPDGIKYFSQNQIFTHPETARLGVFITAYGRRAIVTLLKENNVLQAETLVRLHTDGFHLTQPLPSECTLHSDRLGGLKMEQHAHVHVENVLRVSTCCPASV